MTYWSGKNVEIIDLKDERVIATIALDSKASDVTLNKKENLAYVASENANSIYVINLSSMQLDKVIKLAVNLDILTKGFPGILDVGLIDIADGNDIAASHHEVPADTGAAADTENTNSDLFHHDPSVHHLDMALR